MGGDLRYCLFDIERVARIDYRQIRHGAEDRQVIGGLMTRTVAGGQSGQGAGDLDVEHLFAGGLVNEVVGPARSKHRVSGGEGNEAFLGKTGCAHHQQLLGHTHLVKAIRVCLGEDVQIGVLGEVGSQADDLRAFGGQCGEGVTKGGASGSLAGVGNRGDHRRGGQARFDGALLNVMPTHGVFLRSTGRWPVAIRRLRHG